jgi:hypothetical protein
VLAWRRWAPDGDTRTVLVNMAADEATVDGSGVVQVASDGAREGSPSSGVLGGDTAVILR